MSHNGEGGDQAAKDWQIKGSLILQSAFQGRGAGQPFGQTGYDAQGPFCLWQMEYTCRVLSCCLNMGSSRISKADADLSKWTMGNPLCRGCSLSTPLIANNLSGVALPCECVCTDTEHCPGQDSVIRNPFQLQADLEICTEQLPGKMLHNKEKNKKSSLWEDFLGYIQALGYCRSCSRGKDVSNLPYWIEI